MKYSIFLPPIPLIHLNRREVSFEKPSVFSSPPSSRSVQGAGVALCPSWPHAGHHWGCRQSWLSTDVSAPLSQVCIICFD